MAPGWYRDKATFQRLYAEHENNVLQLSHATGVAPTTLRDWRRKHGDLARDLPGPKPAAGLEGDEQRVLAAIGRQKGLDVEAVADLADLSPKRVKHAVESLREQGFRIGVAESRVTLERVNTPEHRTFRAAPELLDGDLFRFGVVSDTHINSEHEMVDVIHTAYERFASEGIAQVYHPGDLVAGKGIYRHQINDLKVHTFRAQVDRAVELYPRVEGIRTAIIAGNHDVEGEFGQLGADPVAAFCNRRDDFDYLGRYSAFVELPNGARMHMLHPMGGGSYAVSYKAQKIIEGYEGGLKPNVTLFGHWHRRGDFEHRNVQALLCGTTEGSSDLAARVGLGAPSVGFHIVELRIADDASIVEWTPRWFPFYRGRSVR